MNSIAETMTFGNKINVNFLGGQLTSDSGLILYHEFDETFGFSSLIKSTIDKRVYNKKAKHQLSHKLIQKIYQHISG